MESHTRKIHFLFNPLTPQQTLLNCLPPARATKLPAHLHLITQLHLRKTPP